MAGERSLVETLQDEVRQLLEANRVADAQHSMLLDELETLALEHGGDDAHSSMETLSQGLSLVSREAEDEDFVESLVMQSRQRPTPVIHTTVDEMGPAPSSDTAVADRGGTPDDGDLLTKLGDTRKRQHERCVEATNAGFFDRMKALVESHSVAGSSHVERDTMFAKIADEIRAVAKEKERLGEEQKNAERVNEEVSKNADKLFSEVKTIEKKFAERSRFGAWVCDAHAQEVENENCPERHLLKETRLLLHSLKLERRELLLAFELCGVDPEDPADPGSKRQSCVELSSGSSSSSESDFTAE